MNSSPDAPSPKDSPTATPPALPGTTAVLASGTFDSTGIALVIGYYILQGVFPLYFHLLLAAGSVGIIGHRILQTLVSCLTLIVLRRRWAQLVHVVCSPHLLGMLTVCGLLVSANWLVYVYSANSAHTADAVLDYLINPLMTMALASLVLHKWLRPAHRVSIALASAGVALLVVLQGSLPWISLALVSSFVLYGLVKKQFGPDVDVLTGLTMESVVMALATPAYPGHLAWQGQPAWQTLDQGRWILVLLVVAGPVTAVPLLLFAAGTRRVPLSTVGMRQHIAPTIQFLLARGASYERIPPARWAAMVLVWATVAVFTGNAVRQLLRRPRLR